MMLTMSNWGTPKETVLIHNLTEGDAEIAKYCKKHLLKRCNIKIEGEGKTLVPIEEPIQVTQHERTEQTN